MKHDTVVALLKRRLNGRTQTALAKELGIKKSYLSQILRGRVDAGPLVLEALGLERVVTYRTRKPEQPAA